MSLAVSVALAATAASAAPTPDTPRPGKPKLFRDWIVACDNGRACEAASLAEEESALQDVGLIVARDGGGRVTVRIRDMTGKAIQLMHEHYAPGADTGEQMLTHDSEEGGIIVRGRLEVTVGDQVRVLGAGDAYYFDSRIPHRFRNIGDEECEVVTANSPPSF